MAMGEIALYVFENGRKLGPFTHIANSKYHLQKWTMLILQNIDAFEKSFRMQI